MDWISNFFLRVVLTYGDPKIHQFGRPPGNTSKTAIFFINIAILEPDGPGLTNGPRGLRVETKKKVPMGSTSPSWKLVGWLLAGWQTAS